MGLENTDVVKICCEYREKAIAMAKKFLGNKYDADDIGLLLEGYAEEQSTNREAKFEKYAEKWFMRMKNDPESYKEYKYYNWGTIDYLIRLNIKLFGMTTACKTYGDQIASVYSVEEWGEDGKGWKAGNA